MIAEGDTNGQAVDGDNNSNVNEEDINYTSDDDDDWDSYVNLSEKTLDQLKKNDPKLHSLSVYFATDDDEEEFVHSVNWEVEGKCIGESTHVKKINFDVRYEYLDEGERNNFEAFCRGVANNRSIETLSIIDSDLPEVETFASMCPFFEYNDNLREIIIPDCYIGGERTRLLAGALSRRCNKSSLRKIDLYASDVGGEQGEELMTVLSGYHNLVKLCLGHNMVGQGLANMLQNTNHLKKLDGYNNNIDVQCTTILAEALARNKSLNVLDLSYCKKIGDEGAAVLGNGLGRNNSLMKISMNHIQSITSTGWAAFFRGMSNSKSSLNELNIGQNNIGDEGALALAATIDKFKSIKSLDLSMISISANVWVTLLKSLFNPDSVLEKLCLYGNNIDDEVVAFSGGALVNNSTLKSLSLISNRSITGRGWAAFFGRLSNQNSLENLDVSGNNIDDGGMTVLSNLLGNNTALKSLNLTNNRFITPAGWQAFFNRLQTCHLVLEELDLTFNTIDDAGIPPLAIALSNASSLSRLRLGDNSSVTPAGWMALSTLLRPGSSLEELYLTSGNNINDETVIGFANVLVNNTSTKTLKLGYSGSTITLMGWEAITNVLCNKSSIDSIYRSNHTLQNVGWVDNRPDDLLSYLKLNENDNKSEVARQKILQHHFLSGDNINIDEFLDMDMEVLPHAIAWIGRDGTGQSLLFKLVQSMPTLFHSDMKVDAIGYKRKRG